MEELEPKARLDIDDKRHLFNVLLALVERLFMLNKFPVDQRDFALSLQAPEVEDAWELLIKRKICGLQPSVYSYFSILTNNNPVIFKLHLYPNDPLTGHQHNYGKIFIPINGVKNYPTLGKARRHGSAVHEWVDRQLKLERQLLRSIKVIKAIVHSCNTVGQYKRVSPDLLTFLPDKYRAALKDYTKKSPYPAMTIKPEEIETTMATLAYAALQPEHPSEEHYTKRPRYRHWNYQLDEFPRTLLYDRDELRQLQL